VTDPRSLDSFQRLAQRIVPDGELRRVWPLTGGVSAEITTVELARPGGSLTKLVVRRHGEVDRTENPDVARDEYELLRIARARGLAVPKPYLYDESGELFPTPLLVVEFVDGETEFAPVDLAGYVARAAAELVKIHGVMDSPELSFLPRPVRGFGERPAQLDDAMDEGRIRDALEDAWPVLQANQSVLLHGDYWPGNLLWRDGELAAVIDWEDARIGDPLSDLGNARLEFLMAFGTAAMDAFTERYLALSSIDRTNLPHWDLCAALRPCGRLSTWGLDEATERRMRARHARFVARALDGRPRHRSVPNLDRSGDR
jgi:aminoglycoside phosphotransferase (APT) family kinase protein